MIDKPGTKGVNLPNLSNDDIDLMAADNTAPFEELRSVLGLSVEESKAVLSYRKDNGGFKSWEDLAKVPGLDAKKIETRKESIVF